MIDKIKGEPSIEFEKMFPAKQPSRVVVKTKDGNEYEEYMEYPKGDPREPMTMDDLDNKFKALSEGLLGKRKQDEVKNTIFNCENTTAQEFMKQLII